MEPEATAELGRSRPGSEARSPRIARILNGPMLVAAALTLPMVAITESQPGGWLESLAQILNWATSLAFLVEMIVILSVVPARGAWLPHNPLTPIVVFLPPPVLPPGLQ